MRVERIQDRSHLLEQSIVVLGTLARARHHGFLSALQ
jgi:hypothetical protein